MKTLVLCVDRDDDIGVKTGIKGPVVGREDNLSTATKLGLSDPEDSDVNAMLSAVNMYDGLVKEGADVEIATICGDVRVGPASDTILAQQLDRVLEEARPDRVFLVSDGAEDEAFAPILSSRIRIDHVRRVFVRQTPGAESLYYVFSKQMRNPKVRRKIIAPLGLVLFLFGLIDFFAPYAAPALVLIFAGVYLIMISLPFNSMGDVLRAITDYYNGLRGDVSSGDLSIFFTASSIILVIVGLAFGFDLARKTQSSDLLAQALSFVLGALWWCILAVLVFEGGKTLTAYFKHGRVPRHVVAVAGTFVAVGLLVLAAVQGLQYIVGEYTSVLSLVLIYLSIAIAVLLVVATGLSYRTRGERPVEDGWRH
jgi:putative membrane protein